MIKTFLNWLFGLKSPYFTGVNPDKRPKEVKQLDYDHAEIETSAAVDPFGNTKITDSPYPYENQQGQSSCVSHGIGLALAITRSFITGTYTRLGWDFHYRLRSNYPGEGYVIPEGFYNYMQYGAPTYETAPDVATEYQANSLSVTDSMRQEAKIFQGVRYYMISGDKSIDVLANLAANNTPVAISIFSTYQEWAQQYPSVYIRNLTVNDSRAVVNHEICILPKSGFTENGVRYVAVQDSAWFGGYKLRYLSEDFITARVTTAGYWKSVNVLGGGPRPKYVFKRTLTADKSGDDVKALQKLLISERLLPSDCTTGYLGGQTLAGIRAFQAKYASEILTPIGLTQPTNVFGSQSIKKANALCA